MALVNAFGNLALDGKDATGSTPPTGGVGIRGWLSGIYSWVTGGQKTSVNSASVVLASDQPAISVVTTGLATDANQTNGSQRTQVIGNTGNLLQINPDKSVLARPTIGTYTGNSGTSGSVSIPSGAVVRSYAAKAGTASTASLTVPGITGTIALPLSTQFADDPDPGTMIGPATFTFTNTVSYVVIWVQ